MDAGASQSSRTVQLRSGMSMWGKRSSGCCPLRCLARARTEVALARAACASRSADCGRSPRRWRASRPARALRAHSAGRAPVAVLMPPIDGEQASLLALLADGAAWSTSALALALETSQRMVQRALVELEARRTCALDRARARAALAVAAARGIHDDLVTPCCAAARVDWSRGAVSKRARGAKR